tara:strand:- start:146 stop:1588 length:1443 start_codon:yes stop_codon:yes gene_type:complete
MAEKEYTVVAPDGKEITLIGPEGASQDEIIAQAQKLYKPTVAQNQVPQNQVINTDVPTVVSATPFTPVVEPQRSMMDKMKAIYEVPATIGSAAIAQPVGGAYAVYKALTSPKTGAEASAEGRAAGQQLSQSMTYQPTSPVTGEVLQGIGSALEASKLPPVIPSIGVLPSYARMAQGAVPQVKQELQVAKPIAQNMAQALRREPSVTKTAPSAQELAQTSKNLFTTARESGVELNAKDFATNMASIGKELRSEGYDPRLYPKLSVALDEMTQAGIPKDFQELSTLRKFIQGAQKSADPDERRLATILKDDFDNYVSNIPESSVVGGSKEGLAAWKEARDTYSRLSKSEVFTDMLENAQLDKSKFSMSGMENSLAQQLRQLAKNDKKMRLFTAEEQEAIKKAAKGGTGQNALRFIGKFAPTSAVSSIPALLATSVSGPIGLGLTAASMGARVGATQMRKSDVNKLAAIMRAGAKKTQGATNE